LRHRLGAATLDVVSLAGVVLVSHTLAGPGAGMMVHAPAHRGALEEVVVGAFTTNQPL
jgi:hypothetical protein